MRFLREENRELSIHRLIIHTPERSFVVEALINDLPKLHAKKEEDDNVWSLDECQI